MKVWAAIGALVSLLAGGALAPEAGVEREVREPGESASASARASGRAFEGPGFYVWDEDAAEAERWAHDLTEATRARARG